ncbi:MAG: hydroxymethylglutaryl-CoA reductase, degradative [Woeseiaceae bacterium]|nr:hydroxymethylglutaryl-CoA reductase, degradative [Woeseiaceae bacterium]
MTSSSRLDGFHRRSLDERIDLLEQRGFIDAAAAAGLRRGQCLLPRERADRMIENVIGVFGLPFAVAANFVVDGEARLVPMVVEEPSIVAGLGGAAKLALRAGGFRTDFGESLLAGQLQLVDVADVDAAREAIEKARDEILAAADGFLGRLRDRGGGARDLDVRELALDGGTGGLCVQIYVDTCDAMGANLVNTLCERLAPRIEQIAGGRCVLRILSNLPHRSLVTSRVSIPLETLRGKEFDSSAVRDGIVAATHIANADPWRAATHNKGIMNGIDAVAIATGNDWRAIEAGAHAWAAQSGRYRSLTDWSIAESGDLAGRITLPLKVGIVGGSLEANPAVRLALDMLGVGSARELASIMAAVGLAQNFAALRALVTHGIQHGHMRLHARSVASAAGVPDDLFEQVVAKLIESGDIKTHNAKAIATAMRTREAPSVSAKDSTPVHGSGSACGKVILFGEHAAVYGRRALALPIPDAVKATVTERDDTDRIDVYDRGRVLPAREGGDAGESLRDAVNLLRSELGIAGRCHGIRIETRIPPGAGLGASAAFAVALIRAMDRLYDKNLADDDVDALAFECEKLAHGTPSGIDNALATYGRPILYCRESEPAATSLQLAPPPIVIASSGSAGSTRRQVERVRARRESQRAQVDPIFDRMDALTQEGLNALRAGDLNGLGELMNICHGLLNALGVSTPDLERMVALARDAGASGAKLTGAGGGGSIVALCPDGVDDVGAALASAGFDVIDPAAAPGYDS